MNIPSNSNLESESTINRAMEIQELQDNVWKNKSLLEVQLKTLDINHLGLDKLRELDFKIRELLAQLEPSVGHGKTALEERKTGLLKQIESIEKELPDVTNDGDRIKLERRKRELEQEFLEVYGKLQ